MNEVKISDMTMKQASLTLSFREKLELAKLLDRLNVSVIELCGIEKIKVDSLLVKSVASAVKHSAVAVPVTLEPESVNIVWNALKEAKQPRLQVVAAVSSVQMEYIFHKKPAEMLSAVTGAIQACRQKCADVEFIADDATRADEAFLSQIVAAAIEAGATTVTVADAAGAMLPYEFAEFLDRLKTAVPALTDVTLGISCSDALSMADACAINAVRRGAREIKAAAYPISTVSLPHVAGVLASRGDTFGITCSVRTVEMKRVISQITWMCESKRSDKSPFDSGVQEDSEEIVLSCHDDITAVLQAVAALGYDLSEEDGKAVWEAFSRIASRKEKIGSKELDAIVAAAAMQVPPTYTLDTFVINSGNTIAATAHMKLNKQGILKEGIALGDGPIDASFLAIEQITGCHYELDDFQIRAVTEGHEAMGETVVRLLSAGKLYSGRGISTDIIGSSIQAYINALNKIVYEEAEA